MKICDAFRRNFPQLFLALDESRLNIYTYKLNVYAQRVTAFASRFSLFVRGEF